MNITEASHVVNLLRLLDGTYQGANPQTLLDSVDYLRERAEKPLQVRIELKAAADFTVVELHTETVGGQRKAVTS